MTICCSPLFYMTGGELDICLGYNQTMLDPGNSEFNVDTFFGDRQLAGLDDLDRFDGLVARPGLDALDLLDDVVALEDLAEDDVATIEPPVKECC